MAQCFHCRAPIEDGYRPGRGQGCPSCGSDLKVCLNCGFYDRGSYNECRESSAERVVEKDRANFCEHFVTGTGAGDGNKRATDPIEELKKLFKG